MKDEITIKTTTYDKLRKLQKEWEFDTVEQTLKWLIEFYKEHTIWCPFLDKKSSIYNENVSNGDRQKLISEIEKEEIISEVLSDSRELKIIVEDGKIILDLMPIFKDIIDENT